MAQAKQHYYRAQYDRLLIRSQQALEIAKKNNYLKELAQAYNLTGVAYFSESNLPAAQRYFDSTRLTYQSINDSVGLTLALCNLGHVQESYGDYEQALHYYWNEFSVSEAIADTNKMGAAYVDIGRVQQAQGNYTQALPYYEQALTYFQSQQDSFYIANTLATIGNLHTQYQSWELGIDYLKQALEIVDILDNPDQQANILNSLASAYRQKKQLPEALQFYDQALRIDPSRVSATTRLRSLTGAGGTACDLQQVPAAERWMTEAEKWLSQQSTEPHDQLHLETELAKFYKETGQFAEALKHYERADLLEDSLLNAEKINRLSELQTRYETEKKDREITNLQYQQADQKASLMRRSWQRNVSLGLLAGVLLISGLLFRNVRLKQKHQQELLSHEQDLNVTKSRFFADIAHEFRTPLTLIQGRTEQILTRSLDNDCRQKAKLIRKQSNRLLQLVNQILYLSKIEAGVIAPYKTEQDLVAFLRGMVHAYESLAEEREINLRFSSSASRLITSFDKDQFEKIAANLLSNACKFTPAQGSVSLEITELVPDEVEIRVRDNGVGIPAEQIDKVFNRYHSSKGSTLGAAGVGIGLALVKELVEQHQGRISVQSVPNEETIFCITLPVVGNTQVVDSQRIVEDTIVAVTAQYETQTNSGSSIATSLHLLLDIDDNPEIRKYLVDTLSQQYHVLAAKQGEEGLALAYQHIPELVISDVMMKGITGYEVCQQLKNDDRTSHIPVILLTGKSSTEAKISGLEVQADAYLTKPFNSRELLLRITNLIQIRKKLLSTISTTEANICAYANLPTREQKFLRQATAAIEEHLSDESFGVNELCQAIGMSRTQLHRKLKAVTGESTTTFIRQVRLKHSMQLLQTS
ncbi:MAG: ATP-binding protein, partial [Cyclobacteriaceae bacterium]